jgi:4-amino-4-deoxy-L-arabinose transferase-like glycosyltransferase
VPGRREWRPGGRRTAALAADELSAAVLNGETAALARSTPLAQAAVRGFRALATWRHRDAFIIGVAVVAMTALNMLWASLEPRPPHWDKARHLTNSLVYLDTFGSTSFLHWLQAYYVYPPLVYWVTDTFYAVLGTSAIWVAVLSQAVFLAILAFSTYGIGKHLWSRRVGLLAAFFVLTSPMLVSQFKDYMLDAPLTAMVALALYLLVRADAFKERRFSLLFGAACGLGMLTKWNFALSIALPGLVAVIVAVRASLASRSASRIGNIVVAGAAGFAIAGWWYGHNFSTFVSDTTKGEAAAGGFEGDPRIASLNSFLWYSWNLVTNQLYVIPFLLFAAGVVVLLRRKGAVRTNLYPVLLIAGTYLAYTLLRNKDDRYTEPMLPAVAVLATYWLDALRPRSRAWASGAVAVYGAATFLAISFGVGFLPKDVFLGMGPRCAFWPRGLLPCRESALVSGIQSFTPTGAIVTLRGVRIWGQNGFVDGPPSGERWYQEEMFREASRRRAKALWFQSPNDDFIWFNCFATYYFSLRYKVALVGTPEAADFAGIRSAPGQDLRAPRDFAEVKEFPMPDGGMLRLYTRAPTPASSNRPVAATIPGLERLAGKIGHPVYWAGPRKDFTYEWTRRSDGAIFVRYLPAGVRVGDPRGDFLIVATYPYPNAMAALQRVANGKGIEIPGGGLALVHEGYEKSVHLAYPGVDYQVEVYDPSPRIARLVAVSGQVRPVG